MDPCKIIALSYHYIRCFVAMTTAISRNSGRRLNISLSLVPIATKVRPATHICFYTCFSARCCSRTGEKKCINDNRKLFSDMLTMYKLAGHLWFSLTVWFFKGKQRFLVENLLDVSCFMQELFFCASPATAVLFPVSFRTKRQSHHKTRLTSDKAWLIPTFNPDGRASQMSSDSLCIRWRLWHGTWVSLLGFCGQWLETEPTRLIEYRVKRFACNMSALAKVMH